MADLEGDDAFNNVLDRLIQSESNQARERDALGEAQRQVRELTRERDTAIADRNRSRAAHEATVKVHGEINALLTDLKSKLAGSVLMDEALATRLHKAIRDTDEIPF